MPGSEPLPLPVLLRIHVHQLLIDLARNGYAVAELAAESARDGACEVYLHVGPVIDEPRLNDMERAVIEALGARTLTGEELSPLAGYPWDGRFRACLASLRRRGILGNANPGYFVSRQV